MMELFILSFIFFVFCYVQVEVITTIPGLNSSLSPESPPVYYTTHLDVVTFIQPHIVKQLVREGSLSALSLHTLIDRDNVVAVLPSGILKLLLQKEAYECLGLIGTPSSFAKHTYVVDIDLLASSFIPGKPNYERVKQALQSHLPLVMDFALVADSSKNAGMLEQLLGVEVHECQQLQREHNNVMVPLFSESEDNCTPVEFYTWLGCLSNEISIETSSIGSYESSFSTPDPNFLVKKIARRKWTGMLHPVWIQLLLEKLQTAMSTLGPESVGFTAVHIWGFEDAPVTQGKLEHSYFLHGENLHTVVFTSNQQYHLYRSLATWDFTQ
jgi:hypothetical protein